MNSLKYISDTSTPHKQKHQETLPNSSIAYHARHFFEKLVFLFINVFYMITIACIKIFLTWTLWQSLLARTSQSLQCFEMDNFTKLSYLDPEYSRFSEFEFTSCISDQSPRILCKSLFYTPVLARSNSNCKYWTIWIAIYFCSSVVNCLFVLFFI